MIDLQALDLSSVGDDDEEPELHFDVVGNWGGRRAVVAHFWPNGSPEAYSPGDMYLYILVGSYDKCGILRGSPEDDGRPSAWDVATEFTKALQDGVDPRILQISIEQARKTDVMIQRAKENGLSA